LIRSKVRPVYVGTFVDGFNKSSAVAEIIVRWLYNISQHKYGKDGGGSVFRENQVVSGRESHNAKN